MCGFAIFAPECKNRKVTMNATTSFWTRAYRRHISRLIGVCYRYVPDRAVAEDLAHDAFLQAMEKADTLRSFENFGNWLTRIAVNIALHYLRDNHLLMRTDHSVDVEGVLDDDPVDDAEMSAEDMMAAIRKADFTQAEILDAISQIPENHRVVLNLFVFEHYSHQKIAELRGISVNTSKSHLLRARKRLQQILFSKSKQKNCLSCLFSPFSFDKSRPSTITAADSSPAFAFRRSIRCHPTRLPTPHLLARPSACGTGVLFLSRLVRPPSRPGLSCSPQSRALKFRPPRLRLPRTAR